ncbi:hypothetical protein BDV12DRAFT_197314 [Aspergillus spectabilis]
MHAKFLALLALSSVALSQDWLDDAMDALDDLPAPTGVGDDVPTLDDWLEDSDYLDDIDVTNDFGSSDDDNTSSGSSSSSISSSNDEDSDDSDDSFSGSFGLDIRSSILTQLATAIPTSALQELATPASLSSLYSAAQEGDYPAWVTDLPSDVRDYLETAWDVNLDAVPTGSAGDDDDDDDDSSSNNNNNNNNSNDDDDDDGEGDGAGMISPSVLGSIVAAAGVLAVALAL